MFYNKNSHEDVPAYLLWKKGTAAYAHQFLRFEGILSVPSPQQKIRGRLVQRVHRENRAMNIVSEKIRA